MRRRTLAAAAAAMLWTAWTAWTACGPARGGGGQRAPAAPAAVAATSERGAPRRIVSMAPSLTETLFALGLGDRVVGVDDYSAWPPEVAGRTRVGGLFNPNLERIVTLHADLVLLLPSEKDIAVKLGRLGIASLVVPAETLDDVLRSYTAIAARCAVPRAGERLATSWSAALAPRPVGGAPRVMLSIDRQAGRLTGVLAAAHGTFLDELLARLGAVNVFADAATRYPQVSVEEVVARAPQVILELRIAPVTPAEGDALAGDWRQLPMLPAVRDRRITVIAGSYVLVPGPRLPLLYQRMRQALLPGGAVGAVGTVGEGGAAAPGGVSAPGHPAAGHPAAAAGAVTPRAALDGAVPAATAAGAPPRGERGAPGGRG
jgi:iron complex transport system substrate-binding protein